MCALRLLECKKAFLRVRTTPAAPQFPREGGGGQRASFFLLVIQVGTESAENAKSFTSLESV